MNLKIEKIDGKPHGGFMAATLGSDRFFRTMLSIMMPLFVALMLSQYGTALQLHFVCIYLLFFVFGISQ